MSRDAVVSRLQQCLLVEAEIAVAQAERYIGSKRKYQRRWASIYLERGRVAMEAHDLLNGEVSR